MPRSTLSLGICLTLLLSAGSGVAQDTTPPVVIGGCVRYFVGNPEETGFVDVEFSEPLDVLSAILFTNYLDVNSGMTAFEATYTPPNKVRAQFGSQFYSAGSCEQIRITGVKDVAGNEIVDNGVTNVLNFYLYQMFMRAHMELHMQEHDDPPHSFGWEGNLEPLTFSSFCDRPLFDGNLDSLWTSNLFFCLPCTTLGAGPQVEQLEFKFSHQCSELEAIPNRVYPVNLSFQPDGIDTLELWWNDNDGVTAVSTTSGAGSGLVLEPGRPNPSASASSISFAIPSASHTTLDVFDVQGIRVRRLVDEWLNEGSHRRVWDGRADDGRAVASGMYFYRLTSGGASETRKLLLRR